MTGQFVSMTALRIAHRCVMSRRRLRWNRHAASERLWAEQTVRRKAHAPPPCIENSAKRPGDVGWTATPEGRYKIPTQDEGPRPQLELLLILPGEVKEVPVLQIGRVVARLLVRVNVIEHHDAPAMPSESELEVNFLHV